MSIPTLHDLMPDEDREKFDRGKEQLKSLHEGRHFTDWLEIGEGLMAIRRAVMKLHGISKPSGSRYNDSFSKACADTPYAEEHLHPVERSNLLLCVENIAAINEMRADWTPGELLAVSHPATMAKRLRKYLKLQKQKPGEEAEKPRKNSSPMALLKEKVQQLESVIADRDERLSAAEVHKDDPWFELKQNTPEQVADAILASFDLNTTMAIRDRLTEVIDSKPKAAKPKAAKVIDSKKRKAARKK